PPGFAGLRGVGRGVSPRPPPRARGPRRGAGALVEITGLRNPCGQIEAFRPGLLAAVVERARDGTLRRKAGVMGVVRADGMVRPGDAIVVDRPPPPWHPLERV
ncbi:MOSC domain-containing protein, partial [Pinisolibacter sp. MA2-2]